MTMDLTFIALAMVTCASAILLFAHHFALRRMRKTLSTCDAVISRNREADTIFFRKVTDDGGRTCIQVVVTTTGLSLFAVLIDEDIERFVTMLRDEASGPARGLRV